MKKQDVQALYKQIQSKKQTMSPPSLFTNEPKRARRKGCRTCGKVTWRPNQGN